MITELAEEPGPDPKTRNYMKKLLLVIYLAIVLVGCAVHGQLQLQQSSNETFTIYYTNQRGLYAINNDGTNRKLLFKGPIAINSISADGMKLLCTGKVPQPAGNKADFLFDLIVFNAIDSTVRTIRKTFEMSKGFYKPHFFTTSPDSRYVVYAYPRAMASSDKNNNLIRFGVYQYDLLHDKEVQLIDSIECEYFEDILYSIDGRFLVIFVSNRNGELDITRQCLR